VKGERDFKKMTDERKKVEELSEGRPGSSAAGGQQDNIKNWCSEESRPKHLREVEGEVGAHENSKQPNGKSATGGGFKRILWA